MSLPRGGMGQNGVVLLGNKKIQRITVGVIIGVLVISLGLSLLSAGAATLPSVAEGPALGETTTPTPSPGVGSLGSGEAKPVTETPQGQPTQVHDGEHIGGLIAYLTFMLGGVLLVFRARRRDRRDVAEVARRPILS